MGPPNYRGQTTAVYDGLHKREGGIVGTDRRAPSQTSTATPRTRSCMRCAVGMEPVQYIKDRKNPVRRSAVPIISYEAFSQAKHMEKIHTLSRIHPMEMIAVLVI